MPNEDFSDYEQLIGSEIEFDFHAEIGAGASETGDPVVVIRFSEQGRHTKTYGFTPKYALVFAMHMRHAAEGFKQLPPGDEEELDDR